MILAWIKFHSGNNKVRPFKTQITKLPHQLKGTIETSPKPNISLFRHQKTIDNVIGLLMSDSNYISRYWNSIQIFCAVKQTDLTDGDNVIRQRSRRKTCLKII